jgi:hypothetical protein
VRAVHEGGGQNSNAAGTDTMGSGTNRNA